jgi:hypothetical protein
MRTEEVQEQRRMLERATKRVAAERCVQLQAAFLKARDSALCRRTRSTRTTMATLTIAPVSCND